MVPVTVSAQLWLCWDYNLYNREYNSDKSTSLKIIITSATLLKDTGSLISIDLVDEKTLHRGKDYFKDIIETESSKLQRKWPKFPTVDNEVKDMLGEFEVKFLDGSITVATANFALTCLGALPIPSTRFSMMKAWKSPPRKSDDIYHWFIDQIPPQYAQLSRALLSWMALAFRPLKLDELALPLTLKVDGSSDSKDEFRLQDQVPQDLKSDLKCIFGYLVRIEHGEVHFVQKSFRNFILNAAPCREDCILSWSKHMDHNLVAQKCLNYLSLFKKGQRDRADFLEYATNFWPAHYTKAIPSDQLKSALVSFLESGIEIWSESYFKGHTKADWLPSSNPLVVAVGAGSDDLVQMMLNRSHFNKSELQMGLEVAIQRGNEPLVRQLYGLKAESPQVLHIAARYGQENVVETLLDHGAGVMAVDARGMIPLHSACIAGNIPMVETLLKHGSNKEAKVQEPNGTSSVTRGSTPLHLASKFGHDEVVVRLLRSDNESETGVDPMPVDANGSTPLHLACEWQQQKVVNSLAYSDAISQKTGKPPLSELFRRQDIRERTVLHLAAEYGNETIIKKLYSDSGKEEFESMSRMQDEDKHVPLHCASKNGHKAVVEVLLETDATQIQAEDSSNSIPIHLAVSNGHTDAVKPLCQKHRLCDATLDVWNYNIWCPLHLACENGYTEIVRLLFENNAGPNVAGKDGNIPLHLAVKGRFLGTTKELLQNGANFLLANDYGTTPLHLAVKSGNLRLVRQLLKKSKELSISDTNKYLNAREKSGQSSIMLAVQGGHLNVLQELCKAGANLDEVDDGKRNLVHVSAETKHIIILNYLLEERKIYIHSTDNNKKTPLHFGARAGNLNIITELLDRGGNPKALDEQGLFPCEVASNDEVAEKLIRKSCNDLEDDERGRLLKHFAEREYGKAIGHVFDPIAQIDVRDDEGRTPLSHAAASGNFEVVSKLLEQQIVDPNSIDSVGRTPISYAAENGNPQVIKLIAEKLSPLSKVDQRDENQLSPLWYAVTAKKHLAVNQLLELNADPNIKDSSGYTPLHIAAIFGSTEICKALLSSNKVLECNVPSNDNATPINCQQKHLDPNVSGPSGWFPLHAAFDNGEILNSLLKAGARVDAKTDAGETTLSLTADSMSFLSQVKTLLAYNADPLAPNNAKHTPLHIAAKNSHGDDLEILELLLARVSGVIDVTDEYGQTPLMEAVLSGSYEAVKKLVEKRGALKHPLVCNNDGRTPFHLAAQVANEGIDAKDKKGQTPLMEAVLSRNNKAVKILVGRDDVDISQVDEDGHTSLWLAIENFDSEIMEMILDKTDATKLQESSGNLLARAAEKESIQALKLLWPRILQSGSHDAQVFEIAAAQEDIDLIEMILEDGRAQTGRMRAWMDSQRYQHGISVKTQSGNRRRCE
ncbi:hypothetical protein DSL72_000516 [Monilinia vaccinii-corymbosi]|uniref:Uncharacterized protein n=1 Tax=Monilinia vaccinii-corymbosi TaxID=61207 RepID=A0A8A3PAC4_9HELO|nr:hypothetical protein DSL72_000516 [Monilinia vaccinii-corymbosi]